MATVPELYIAYDTAQFPVSATCSVCQTQMRHLTAQGASSAETLRWFSVQFGIHLRYDHMKPTRKKSQFED